MLTGLNELLEYTAWQRQYWQEWIRRNGLAALNISAGPGGDGRFETVRDLIAHIFSAEKRYIQRLTSRPLTQTGDIPSADPEALFGFGAQSRREFTDFISGLRPEAADSPIEMKLLDSTVTATPRKILIHVVTHEIRHWAQIATLLRLNGFKVDFQDFLFSPILNSRDRSDSPGELSAESAASGRP